MSHPETGPNAEQAAYWDEVHGQKWVSLQERIDAQIAPIGLRALDRAAPRPGERCLDVGCGCGQTSLQLAERVGSQGSVTGIDLSGPMLERAGERARAARLPARFERGDAQIHGFEPDSVDLVFSRLGVMFFQDPVAAFANLRRALAPGGRLVFVCWRAPEENAWITLPMAAAAKHIAFDLPTDPLAPGPFSLADASRVRGILGDAGYEGVTLEPLELEIEIGGRAPLAESVEFMLQIGPTARALADAEPTQIEAVRASVREALAPYHRDGVLRLGSATWIVSGR